MFNIKEDVKEAFTELAAQFKAIVTEYEATPEVETDNSALVAKLIKALETVIATAL